MTLCRNGLMKSQAAQNLIFAIETVASGGTFYGAPEFRQCKTDVKPNPDRTFKNMIWAKPLQIPHLPTQNIPGQTAYLYLAL